MRPELNSKAYGGINLFTSLIWLVSSVFIIHDFEEIIVIERWLQKNEKELLTKIPKTFHSYFQKIFPKHTAGFALAVLVEYIVILLFTIIAIFVKQNYWSVIGILSIVTLLFLHCFTHISQSIILKRYTPGVFTAIVLLIPFSLYFYYVDLTHQMINWRMIWISLPIGVVIFVLFNQLGFFLGKKLEK